MERFQFLFNLRKQFLNRVPLGFQCEMDRYARSFVARAHPEIVGGNASDFRNEKMRRDLVLQLFNRQDRIDGIFASDEILGLKLFSIAWRKIEFEMRKPLVPRT